MAREDCSLLDQPEVLRIMFYPRRDFRPDAGDERNISFEVADGICVGGRLHLFDANAPLIVLFHGNGEIVSDYDDIATLYLELRISLLIVDYRGYGTSDGTPTASDLLDDAMTAYRQLPGILSERGIEPSRLIIMGRSLGSAAALEIASQVDDEISGLIIESGFSSAGRLMERLSGMSMTQLGAGADGFDNAGKIEKVEVPTLIIHGENDMILPVTYGQELYSRSAGKDKKMVLIPDAGHNDLLLWGRDLYFGAVREFVFE